MIHFIIVFNDTHLNIKSTLTQQTAEDWIQPL